MGDHDAVQWIGSKNARHAHAVPREWRWSPGCEVRALCGVVVRAAWPGYLLPPGVCPDCRNRTGTAPPAAHRRPHRPLCAR